MDPVLDFYCLEESSIYRDLEAVKSLGLDHFAPRPLYTLLIELASDVTIPNLDSKADYCWQGVVTYALMNIVYNKLC